MKKIKICTIFITLLFLFAGFTTSTAIIIQSGEKTADTGSISILVYEDSEEPGATPKGIENAKVDIENLDNGYTQTLTTNEKGNCYFEGIPLGVYVIFVDGGSSYGNITGKAILTEDDNDATLQFSLEKKSRSFSSMEIISIIFSYLKQLLKNYFVF